MAKTPGVISDISGARVLAVLGDMITTCLLYTSVDREYERNMERYVFLKWGQNAFNNFRVVPPGTGICHQVNLEYLAQTVWTDTDQNGNMVAYPDTLVGLSLIHI